MTRIIGGLAGSLQLAPPAKSTRPTSDRVRESIFNRLSSLDLIADSRVLDLFAGTGALGLEALSRGASKVILVENNRQAVAACKRNVERVLGALNRQGVTVECNLVAQDAAAYDQSLTGSAGALDLVFIDPHYDYPNEQLEELLRRLHGNLDTDARVLVERSSRTPEFELPPGFALELRKDYGDTSVFWLEVD